jgi:hypothetical protein
MCNKKEYNKACDGMREYPLGVAVEFLRLP